MHKLVIILLIFVFCCVISCTETSEDNKNFGSINNRVSYLEGKIKSLETRYDILARRIDSKSFNSKIKTEQSISQTGGKQSSTPVKENITLKLDAGFYDDAYIGTSTPDILVVVYSDFSCEKCRSYLLQLISSLREKYKSSLKVQARLRDYPLDKYPKSSHLAEASHCVGEQGHYWNFIELLLKERVETNEDILKIAVTPTVKLKDISTLSRCLKSNKYQREISLDKDSGIALGVEGVPSVFIGKKATQDEFKGALIRGNQDISIIHKYIDHLEANSE